MWDWDAEQAAKKKSAPKPAGAWLGGGVGGLIGVVIVARLVLLVLHSGHSGETTGHPFSLGGAAPAQQTEGPSEEELERVAGILLDQGMTPRNPNAQNLGPTETLVLADADNELHLTPGAVTVFNAPCFGGPLIAIRLTATVTEGSPTWETTDFKLLDNDNHELRLLTQCATANELDFPATAARWLVYAPGDGPPEARWRLS
ncbi:hypothetical protein ODJ79_18355 [Actinoplanes sp. KI2]|uniref:hypothetical protein n=1 Tax=Actinoplanes sp. KI2 TaxID=2983315 RepID=UPI0021D5C0CE|nr:hypothetical protein [Actinoplanes sp. KI2]MCU7725695.1 hypothetical protein [Actinoplanes sp. KI2]